MGSSINWQYRCFNAAVNISPDMHATTLLEVGHYICFFNLIHSIFMVWENQKPS